MRTCPLTILALAISTTVARSQGYSPQEALKHMTTASGLTVALFASEPEVRQPIFVKCDDRGRLWTIQYLQYPNPAGLNRVKVDRWSRTVYDRVPEPPPRGPRGADRITILEDTDGDGRADVAKDFIDGLNLVTGVEFGHGGVFVLNVPYLLFYPDKNGDDVPDTDPEVLLIGFGMEDAQAMSNHLTWGPDGWLYGVNGSTTTCRIRGVEFQQGLWRYHPVTREFELFCEGGGNCYGVTFDANGECYYSTNAGPFVHAVQGGYYYKSFGKHGPLHNLFAYHWFPELERDQAPGGPPTGGTIYLADAFPYQMRGAFIAGNFLGHTVSWWNVTPNGSTVRASYGGVLWDSHDTWSGPTDVCLAPDGSLYVSDFYDQRTAHPDPDANWDRSNGRIYKISAEAAQPSKPIDIGTLSTNQLIDLLAHANHWYAVRARVELARRRDAQANKRLRTMATQTEDSRLALEGLWTLHAVGGFDDRLAFELLKHPYPYVRYWAIRFVGDERIASSDVLKSFVELASREESPVVRGQLAATAKRLPAKQGLPIVEALLHHFPNESDSRIPWLIWWAIESKAISDADYVVEMFTKDKMWANPLARDNIFRLIRRFAAEGKQDGYNSCFNVIASSPAEYLASARRSLRQGLAERAVGLQGIGQGDLFGDQAAGGPDEPITENRKYEPVSGPLREYVEGLWRQQPGDELSLELALRADVDDAPAALSAAALEPRLIPEGRVQRLGLLREFGEPGAGADLVALVFENEPEPVRLAALDVLASYGGGDEITQALLSGYSKLSTSLQSKVRDILISRPASALALLERVDAGAIAADDVSIEQLRHAALHDDEEINALMRKHWGNIGPGSAEEKLATMRRYNNDLRAGAGDQRSGKELFAKHCAICHEFNGEGNKIGPDLTTANRQDLAALLANIVDPSAVIRREFISYVVVTISGRVCSGLLAEQDGRSITILDAENQRVTVPRDEIETLVESEVSLMPERILDSLTPQQLRDLFAYIQAEPAR
jgi:putative membrane-bound dehydrogenase-like protein